MEGCDAESRLWHFQEAARERDEAARAQELWRMRRSDDEAEKLRISQRVAPLCGMTANLRKPNHVTRIVDQPFTGEHDGYSEPESPEINIEDMPTSEAGDAFSEPPGYGIDDMPKSDDDMDPGYGTRAPISPFSEPPGPGFDDMLSSEEEDKQEEKRQAEASRERRGPSRATSSAVSTLFRVSADKHRKRNPEHERMHLAAAAFAEKHLRRHVTLPPDLEGSAHLHAKLDSGERLDVVSCAVHECAWGCRTCLHDTAYADQHPYDLELRKHVLDQHGEALRLVSSAWMTNSEVQRMGEAQFLWDLYKQALAVQERKGFPTVGVSVDRRAFEYTNLVYNDARVRSLMCFTCACIRLDTGAVRSEIRYRPASFLLSNMPLHRLKDFFGFADFSRRYMQAGTPLYPRDKSLPSADFSDWKLGCRLSFLECD